jgi:hypothetical protein
MTERTSPLAGSVRTLTARSTGPGRIDLFLHAGDGEVWYRLLEDDAGRDEASSQWTRAGSYVDSPKLSSASTSPHRFVVGAAGTLLHLTPGRSSWDDLGGDITGGDSHVAVVTSDSSGIDAVSGIEETDGGARLDVFALWAETAIVRRSLRGREWSPWELIEILRAAAGTHTVLRSRDLVSLIVRSTGLREEIGTSGVPEWIADGAAGGRLIVEFPPQHIAETVLTNTTSSAARLAGPSSLHFIVANERIALSAAGVLRAMATLPLAVTPRAQGASSTLEFPWRLLLALQRDARCVHRQLPASSADGVSEMWHTRVLGPAGSYAEVYPFASLPLERPFAADTPLRDSVATIASQGAAHPDQPVATDRLILGACGAWFSGSGSWPAIDWTHKTAMARDYYVRVLKRGFLFPFGHRAAVVETTERRFETAPLPVAGLRTTWTLVITEPSRQYGIGAPHERAFPFQRIEIEPRLVAPVDDPAGAAAFWPKRGGQPLIFTVRGTNGPDVIEMQMPLLFSDGTALDLLDGLFSGGPQGIRDVDARPRAPVGRFMALAMKSEQDALEGATQHVRALTFGGVVVAAAGPGFHPKIAQLEVELPAVNQLLGPMEALSATLSNELLNSTPSAPPDVLLDFPSRVLKFGSAKAGVVAAPNVAVDRISRTLGPIAALPSTNPADLFGPDAKLLGVVPLADIIPRVTGQPSIRWTEGLHPTAVMTWKETLKERQGLAFIPGTASSVTLDVTSTVDAHGKPHVITHGVITDFALNIPPGDDPLVTLAFNDLTFDAETGGLPTTSIRMEGARFGGKLKFIQTLSNHLPSVGNSGPKIEVGPTGIKASYAIAIPTPIGMGVFTLQNLLLQAGITVSLVNQPITIDFAFGTRANPFLVTVTGFGGGGYLELGIGAGGDNGGLQRFVGGIEFGASVAMSFGVADGEVHVFGGIVFTKAQRGIEIAGYLRIGGMVRVLGLISVSIELTVSLTFVEPNILRGAAKLVIAVDLTFWSTSVEIACEKSFSGSPLAPAAAGGTVAGSPESSVVHALGPVGASFPWHSYCRAFAGE